MKILHAVLSLMFLVFAALQLNDPDPYIWIPVYGAMAVICIMAMYDRFNQKIMISLLVAYGLYSIYYFPGVRQWLEQDNKAAIFDNVAKMEHPFIEESREFLGLIINITVLLFYLVIARRRTQH